MIPDDVRESLNEILEFGEGYFKGDVDLKRVKDWLDSLPTAPEPDWSTAPEWANWWAIDAYSHDYQANYCWYEKEPSIGIDGSWHMEWGEGMCTNFSGDDLPIGCDWRTTLRKRQKEESK